MADELNDGLPASTVLMDELIRHQVYVERYKAGEIKNLVLLLSQLRDDVSAQLGKRLPDVSSPRSAQLQALLADIGRISDQAAQAQTDYAREQLRQLTAYEGGFNASALRAVLPITVSVTTVSDATLWAAVTERPFEGRDLSTWFGDYSAIQKKRLQEAVRMGVVEGQTIDQMVRRVRGTQASGYTDGLIGGIQRRSAEALVRTATNHIVTTARQATFTANSDEPVAAAGNVPATPTSVGVVASVMWRSTLDGKTSLICQSRDGQVYPVGSGPRPPAHPNCRSTIVPVLKSWKELGINLDEAPAGTRASMNGQVPEAETYQTWLTRQPAKFQDDVLGTTRGRLFRSGRLTLDKFVDQGTAREYTLDQLRQKHPEAFKVANV